MNRKALFFVAGLAVGLTFAVGVIVGRGTSEAEQATVASDPLSATVRDSIRDAEAWRAVGNGLNPWNYMYVANGDSIRAARWEAFGKDWTDNPSLTAEENLGRQWRAFYAWEAERGYDIP